MQRSESKALKLYLNYVNFETQLFYKFKNLSTNFLFLKIIKNFFNLLKKCYPDCQINNSQEISTLKIISRNINAR